MCFYNGLYINQSDYEVLLPDLSFDEAVDLPILANTYYYTASQITDAKIKNRAIYFNFKVNEKDITESTNSNIKRIIDVYYVSSIPGNRIETMGDLIIDCVKVYAKEDLPTLPVIPIMIGVLSISQSFIG